MIDANPGRSRPLYRLKRWMYPHGRPNLMARFLNQTARWQFSSGALAPRRCVLLEVPGRRTGRPTSVPLVIADHAGERYLVAMLGPDTNWVRNVRATGGRGVLRRRGRREQVRLDDVDVDLRAPIIRRYLQVAPGARPHIPVDRRAPIADFDHIAARLPVFRIGRG